MFKYLWIVIIALIALCFIWYTAACILKAYQFTKDWPSALSYLSDKHCFLCSVWFAFMIVSIIALFAVSLCAYVSALE